jgi:homopolymeric O-antigen transport system permease protein
VIRWLSELRARRELLYMLTWREVTVKYKQSVMGYLWAILMPLVIVGAGLLVRGGVAMLTGKALDSRELATVAVKSVPWAFFVSAIRFASLSLVGNATLVTKIYFPREIFPFAAVLSQLVDLAVAATLLTVVLAVIGVSLSWHVLWVPLLLALLVLLAAGFGLLLSALSLFFRDVKYLVEVFLTFAIFFTPVFYDVSLFGHWGPYLMLNPVAPLLEAMSGAIVTHHLPTLGWIGYSAAWAIGGFALALALFKRWEPAFAENI